MTVPSANPQVRSIQATRVAQGEIGAVYDVGAPFHLHCATCDRFLEGLYDYGDAVRAAREGKPCDFCAERSDADGS